MSESVNLNPNEEKKTVWQVVKHTFQVFFHFLQYWFLFNISFLSHSLLIVSIPGAKAALTAAVWKGLENVDGMKREDVSEMRPIVKRLLFKALKISLLKNAGFFAIGFSIWFWVSRPEVGLRYISILAIYGLVLGWMTNFYLYPVLVEDETRSVKTVFKKAFLMGFQHPFESLLFGGIDFVLFLIEVLFFGPLMVVAPSLRRLLSVLGYWHVIGKDVHVVVREFTGFKFLKPKE